MNGLYLIKCQLVFQFQYFNNLSTKTSNSKLLPFFSPSKCEKLVIKFITADNDNNNNNDQF